MPVVRESFEPRHAVTHKTTKDGPKIVDDQVVTAEADARPVKKARRPANRKPEVTKAPRRRARPGGSAAPKRTRRPAPSREPAAAPPSGSGNAAPATDDAASAASLGE